MSGRIEAIAIAARAGEPLRSVERVEAIAGKGLAGDRYAEQAGEFSDETSGHRDITLISAEALESMAAETGIDLSHVDSRRNVLVRGLDVSELVGRRFRLGDIECVGNELSHPCAYLQRLTHPGVLAGLVDRGGLRAGIVTGGLLEVGDAVEPLEPGS